MFARLIILIFGLAGGGSLAQMPEIATQYEQRLGGAVSELGAVIRDFDLDSEKNGLTRAQALLTYQRSAEPFLQDRGLSMQTALARFDRLSAQIAAFQSAHEFYKPVYLVRHADTILLEGVRADYSLGLPVTSGGFLYGGIGAVFGALFGRLLTMLAGLSKTRAALR